MDSHHADNPPNTGENTTSSGANEEYVTTSAKTLNGDQDSESIPIKENTHIGAVNIYEATQFWEYPILRIHPNSPAVGATIPTHMDGGPIPAKQDPGNIPGVNNLHVGVHYHASTPPTGIQNPAATYSIPQQFNPGEVAGAPRFPMPRVPRHSIPERFIPGQAAGAATGTSGRPVRRFTCSFCHELGHRVDGCLHLPCKRCGNMGHIVRTCPIFSRDLKWVAKCSICKEPGHRRDECPSRPCRYCAIMGHVGKDCLNIVARLAVQERKADARRQAQ